VDDNAKEEPVSYAEFRQLYTLLADMFKDKMACDSMQQEIVLEYLDIRAKFTSGLMKLAQKISKKISKEMERRKRSAEAYIS
jgi:protease II